MYTRIMVPVDLGHEFTQENAVGFAVDLAKLYKAKIYLVGVTTSGPTRVAHNEKEFEEKLANYAETKSAEYDVQIDHKSIHCNDPAAELDDALVEACEEINADMIVMASHVPRIMDHFFRSNASRLVTHTSLSVVIVR